MSIGGLLTINSATTKQVLSLLALAFLLRIAAGNAAAGLGSLPPDRVLVLN